MINKGPVVSHSCVDLQRVLPASFILSGWKWGDGYKG